MALGIIDNGILYIYIYTCIYTLYMCMCGAALLTTVCCPFISSIAVPEGLGGRRGGTWEKGGDWRGEKCSGCG